MYRLMIVDDDALVRERLRRLIRFADLQLDLVCEAGEGEEALALYEQYRPNLLVSDINIPLVDGLELIRRIHAVDPDVQAVVITGFATMGYAQESMRLGTVDFLLKPVDENELNTALKNAICRLCERTATVARISELEEIARQSLPILRERYLNSLVQQPQEEDECAIRDHLTKLQLEMAAPCHVAVAMLPDYTAVNIAERENIQLALCNLVQTQLLAQGFTCVSFTDASRRLVFVVGGEKEPLEEQVEEVLIRVQDQIRFYFHSECKVGVGNAVTHLSWLHQSFANAVEAVKSVAIYGRNNVVNSKNVHLRQDELEADFGREMGQLMTALKTEDRRDSAKILYRYLNRAWVESNGDFSCVQQECMKILSEILTCSTDLRWSHQKIFDANPYRMLLDCKDIVMAQEALCAIANKYLDALVERRHHRGHRLVDEAKAFIRDNHTSPELNLSMVSAHVGLSTAYFCNLFKEETRQTFTEFLNAERISHAKALLTETDRTTEEVAHAVGFNNPSYFFEVFKRLTGERPRRYAKTPQD